MVRSLRLAAFALLLTLGLPLPATGTTVPLPLNGDFEAGSVNWFVEDAASVRDGHGEVGQPGCFGDELAAIIGRLTTASGMPLVQGQRLAYDYRITTSEPLRPNALRVVVIDPTFLGNYGYMNVDIFNPNEGLTTCNTYEGTRVLTIPMDFVYGRLSFQVWGDGYGDLFHAEIDNVRLLADP